MIHKRFAGYKSMIEDLAQSGRVAIMEHMADYNPQYKLTTFFSFHIQNALQELVNKENGESHYYAESKNIIVKTMRQLGMDFDNIDEQVLAMHLNMTTGRLHSILEKTLRKKKVELIEEDGETSSEYFDSPETAFIKTEMQQEFRDCIESLDETEQIVLCMHFGFYYPGFNEDERVHKLSEIQKALDLAGYGVNAINEYRSARRHIADVMYKRGLVGKRNKYQSAKEEIGLKFTDIAAVNEMFDALNELEDEQ
jgi:RNA polymerase sigma factor (sigma-70 family)